MSYKHIHKHLGHLKGHIYAKGPLDAAGVAVDAIEEGDFYVNQQTHPRPILPPEHTDLIYFLFGILPQLLYG